MSQTSKNILQPITYGNGLLRNSTLKKSKLVCENVIPQKVKQSIKTKPLNKQSKDLTNANENSKMLENLETYIHKKDEKYLEN